MREKEEKEALVEKSGNKTKTKGAKPKTKNGEKGERGGKMRTGGREEEEGRVREVANEEEEGGGDEEGKWKNVCPPFGVRSYLHQFYAPQPVKNPGIYEFPNVNVGIPDDADAKKRTSYGKLFTVVVAGGLLLSIISGILLSLQYFSPHVWFQMNEMWTLSGFLGGIFIIMTAILIRLLMSTNYSPDAIGIIEVSGKDTLPTPELQGAIPLIKEIQAIQPPQESIVSCMK